jgi:hypothetical protein
MWTDIRLLYLKYGLKTDYIINLVNKNRHLLIKIDTLTIYPLKSITVLVLWALKFFNASSTDRDRRKKRVDYDQNCISSKKIDFLDPLACTLHPSIQCS